MGREGPGVVTGRAGELPARTGCGAKPSYPGADSIIRRPDVVAHLDRYAVEWKRIADATWKSDLYHEGRSVVVPFLGRINVYEVWPDRMGNAEEISARKSAAALTEAVMPPARAAAGARR